jgi:ABC-type polysaccharide/polyol phosphate export permease
MGTLFVLVRRNIIVRYKHSILGILWGFIKPIVYLLIFIVVFSSQFPTSSSFILYFLTAILFWFFFSNAVSQGMISVVTGAGILKSLHINANKIIIAELYSEIFNLMLSFIVFFAIAPFLGFKFTVYLWFLPLYFVIFAIFTLGVLYITATLHTFFRDMGILWNTIQPALFYLTPIAYKTDIIPAKFKLFIYLNPIFYFIKLLRYPLIDCCAPDTRILLMCILLALSTYSIGFFMFTRLKPKFISVI